MKGFLFALFAPLFLTHVPHQPGLNFQTIKKQAEGGDKVAQYNLGVRYDKGNGVPQDYKKAVKWYTKSAEQGLADAQGNLGLMYAQGKGVIEDYITAYAWLSVAKEYGNANAAKGLDLAKKLMTKEQIAEGQKLAREIFKRMIFSDDFPQKGVVYTVKKGETVSSIAQKCKSKVKWIIHANKIVYPTELLIGKELFVPLRR